MFFAPFEGLDITGAVLLKQCNLLSFSQLEEYGTLSCLNLSYLSYF